MGAASSSLIGPCLPEKPGCPDEDSAMKGILFKAMAAPYEIVDEKTGKENKGISGKLWFAKAKPSAKPRDVDYSVGTDVKIVKCSADLAKAIKEVLAKAGQPLVCNIDLEVSGNGINAKEEATDFEPLGLLSEFRFTFKDGLVRREKAATDRVGTGASNGESSQSPLLAGTGTRP